ncbi:MAG: family glycosyltransferase [Spartobacteria bacterium]|nr:family glycosyltransferase [Spartobacteria bacterium]
MSEPPLLSVIVPCYNEEKTLETIVQKVLAVELPIEMIVVDDGSKDGSRKVLESIAKRDPRVRAIFHPKNAGKGAALATGFKEASGTFVIVQDADMEYDPNEFYKLLLPALVHDADAVFGSRFQGSDAHRVLYFWHSIGNWGLTLLSNMASNYNLTDMETCYKLFRREIIQGIELRETRFGFEPEVTAKLARMDCRVYEVGISYDGRSYEEGKKIGLKDAFRAFYCIVRYGFLGGRMRKPERRPLPEKYRILAENLARIHKNSSLETMFAESMRNDVKSPAKRARTDGSPA